MQNFATLVILLVTLGVAAAFVPWNHAHAGGSVLGSSTGIKLYRNPVVLRMVDDDDASTKDQKEVEATTTAAAPAQPNNPSPQGNDDDTNKRYDVSKLVSGGGGGATSDDSAGFNQFDPVLSATGFMSRRFGIVGGLAIFGALAAVEGKEILSALGGASSAEGSGETTTTPSGLKITEVRVGKGGSAPLPGYVIGLRAVVSIGDNVIYDTSGDKPIAFKYGQRPFQNVLCEGVEEGIKGMKVGGRRILDVPSSLAPPGVDLPPGVPLIYEVELTEVLSGYF